MIGRMPMLTSGFGMVSECSRRRVPRPPQNSTTFIVQTVQRNSASIWPVRCRYFSCFSRVKARNSKVSLRHLDALEDGLSIPRHLRRAVHVQLNPGRRLEIFSKETR